MFQTRAAYEGSQGFRPQSDKNISRETFGSYILDSLVRQRYSGGV